MVFINFPRGQEVFKTFYEILKIFKGLAFYKSWISLPEKIVLGLKFDFWGKIGKNGSVNRRREVEVWVRTPSKKKLYFLYREYFFSTIFSGLGTGFNIKTTTSGFFGKIGIFFGPLLDFLLSKRGFPSSSGPAPPYLTETQGVVSRRWCTTHPPLSIMYCSPPPLLFLLLLLSLFWSIPILVKFRFCWGHSPGIWGKKKNMSENRKN